MKKILIKAFMGALITTTAVGVAIAADHYVGEDDNSSLEFDEHLSWSETSYTTPDMSAAALRAHLEEQGYVVFEIEHEGPWVEAKVLKNAQRWELELDPSSGMIIEQELDE